MTATKSETAANAPAVAAAVVLTLMSKDVIKTQQDGIRTSLLGMDQLVHQNAVQCLMHAEKHQDTSLMRRLIVETLGQRNNATGYRTAGLINWMRKYSPLELTQDSVNMSGTDGKGNKRPFLIEEANAQFFWSDKANAERVAKPVFQSTVLNPVDRALKQTQDALENTVNGQPVDASKPFYDGVAADKVVEFLTKVKELRGQLPADSTEDVRKAQARIAADTAFVGEVRAA